MRSKWTVWYTASSTRSNRRKPFFDKGSLQGVKQRDMALLCPASYASAIVLEDGCVAVFGDWGPLPSTQPVPLGDCWDGERVLEATRAIHVVVGECHGVLVSEDAQLFSWGQVSLSLVI